MNRLRATLLARLIAVTGVIGFGGCAGPGDGASRTAATQGLPPSRAMVVAYVPTWIDLAKFVPTIDYEKVTHLNLAFANPTDDAGDLSFNPQAEALIAAAHARGVKVLISIGGGSAADDRVLKPRYFSLLNPAHRAGFVAKLTAYVMTHRFDGLDVDIEGPSIDADFGPFVRELAAALHPAGKLLTAALSQGYGGKKVPDAALGVFDFVNIMAYDATGDWEPKKPGQHSALEYAHTNVAYWLRRGLPKTKCVLGVPFYGYGFGAAFRKHDYSYREIVERFPGAEQRDQTGDTIWYNGIPTIRAKAQWARDEGLAGVMIWSLDYDVPGPRSLLTAIAATLNPPGESAR